VRASATSRAASPANYLASQAKADANKAENDSPFALLVASIAPKDAAKPAIKDASQPQTDSKPAEDQPNPAQDNPTANAPAEPVAAGSASPPSKPEKSGKTKDEVTSKSDKVEAGQDDIAALMTLPQQDIAAPPQPQLLPPPAPLPVQAPDADDEQDVQLAAAAPTIAPVGDAGTTPLPPDIKPSDIAPPGPKEKLQAGNGSGEETDAPAPKTDLATPVVTARVANPVASPAPGIAGNVVEDETADEQTATPAASGNDIADIAAAPAPGKSGTVPQAPTVTDQPAAKTADVPNDSAQSEHAKSRASATAIQNAAPQSAAAKTTLTNPGHGETEPKAGAPKARLVQPDANSEGKGETEKSDAPTALPQPAPQEAAPKAAPQPAPNAIDAINSIAAPQAQSSPVAAATVNQHIQVTIHAAPDLPALAVEIAAKSQSGAKQFDIRLDPPELGRVEVRLSIDATGKASAHLSADQPHTLSLLQKDSPILARALRDAGLDVAQNGLNFSLRQQGENFHGNASSNGRRGSARSFPLSASLAIDATAGSAPYRGPANGRLDIRV